MCPSSRTLAPAIALPLELRTVAVNVAGPTAGDEGESVADSVAAGVARLPHEAIISPAASTASTRARAAACVTLPG
jgi:hypothetical protein